MIELKNDNIIPGFDDETNKELRINLFKAQAEDVIIVSPKGYIDTYNTAFFNKKMEAVLKKYHKIIFDLSGINYVSSTGIGAFTGLLRHIKPKGGDMILINVQPKVYEVFSLLGFTSFFNFSHNIESALEEFNNTKVKIEIFPKTTSCPICSKQLRLTKSGRFRCPACKTIIQVDNSANVYLG